MTTATSSAGGQPAPGSGSGSDTPQGDASGQPADSAQSPAPTQGPRNSSDTATQAPAVDAATQPGSSTATVAMTAASVAPTTQAAPSAPTATVPARVSLQDAIDTIHTTIENSSQGVSQARIELSPPELGTIRIQLQRTDSGVTAHVVAEHAATADTLSQGGDDLRRSLANAGVTLLSLDIESRDGNGAQSQDPSSTAGSAHTSDTDQADAIADGGAAEQTTSALSGSALVNVLA